MGLADPRAIQLSRRRVLLRPAAQALLRARCRVHRSHQEAVQAQGVEELMRLTTERPQLAVLSPQVALQVSRPARQAPRAPPQDCHPVSLGHPGAFSVLEPAANARKQREQATLHGSSTLAR